MNPTPKQPDPLKRELDKAGKRIFDDHWVSKSLMQPDPIMQILSNLLAFQNGEERGITFDQAHQQLQAHIDTEIRNSLATYEKEMLIDYEADKAEAVRLGKIEELKRAKLQGYINGHRMHSVDHRIAKLKEEL